MDPGRKVVTLTKLLKWLPDLRKGEPGPRVEGRAMWVAQVDVVGLMRRLSG
jgi:hypothetical protein